VNIVFVRRSILAWAWACACAPRALHAQPHAAAGAIDGAVTDTNLVALNDATVSILGSHIRVVTGGNGRFRIVDVPAGRYIVVVHRLGYRPASTSLEVAANDTIRPSIALQHIVTALDTVVVEAVRRSARMMEFDYRRKVGQGEFMTAEQIEAHNVVVNGELFRRFMGVDVVTKGLAQRAISHRAGCAFKFYVDGVSIPTPDLNSDLPGWKDMAGIEVYRGVGMIPPQYNTTDGGGFCGVILVWTKDG
jgi:hypothetical protein